MRNLLFAVLALAIAAPASAQADFAVHNVTNDEITYSTVGRAPVTAPRDILAWSSPHNLELTALDLTIARVSGTPIAAPPFAADSLAEALDSLDLAVRGLLRDTEEQAAMIANQAATINTLQSQVDALESEVAPLRARVDSLRAEQSYALGVVRDVIRLLERRP